MLPSVGPRGARGPGEPPGPFSKLGVLLPGPQAPGISSAVAGRGLGTGEVARGPPGRLTSVWMSVQSCQQSTQGPRRAEQGGRAGGTGQRLPGRAASWLRGLSSLPCPLSPPTHQSPGPPSLRPPAQAWSFCRLRWGKGWKPQQKSVDRPARGGVEGSRRGRAMGGRGSPQHRDLGRRLAGAAPLHLPHCPALDLEGGWAGGSCKRRGIGGVIRAMEDTLLTFSYSQAKLGPSSIPAPALGPDSPYPSPARLCALQGCPSVGPTHDSGSTEGPQCLHAQPATVPEPTLRPATGRSRRGIRRPRV